MRRRILSAGLAVLLGTSLAVAPASSQDADFTITPTEGQPGDVVNTSLDPDALADACYTEPADILPQDGAGEPSPIEVVSAALAELLQRVEDEEDPLELANEAQMLGAGAVGIIMLFMPLLPTAEENAQQLLDNLLVLTFADVGTMEPVGERSNFDGTTGAGSITVPELSPGLWAVAATCVWPVITEASFLAMAEAAGAALLEFYDGEVDPDAVLPDLLNTETGLAETLLGAALPAVAQPRAQWVHPFTIPAALPEADPAVAAFCAAIPQLPGLGETLISTLAGLPEDDGTMTQEQWAATEDWAALATELQGIVGTIEQLLEDGDTSRPSYLADEWAAATSPLRQVRDALQAVDYDLSTESGRMIAGQLREQATAQGDGDGEDPAVAALTEWFLENCLPEAPVDPPAAAPAATPRGAQPRYTG